MKLLPTVPGKFLAASRPTQVWEDLAGTERLFKELSYATGNRTGEWSLGKLVEARRHNYLDLEDPMNRSTSLRWTTSQRMVYGGLGGRVSKQVVTAIGPDGNAAAFDTEYVFDSLGNVTSLAYPDCLHAGCNGGEVGSLSMAYSEGLLTGITGYVTGITYHPNGMVNAVTHENGQVDTIMIATHGMARPSSISSSGVAIWDSGSYAYDGAGNIKGIGSDKFQYDRVDRLVRANLDGSIASGHYRGYEYDIHGNRLSIDKNGMLSNTGIQAGTNRLSAASYDLAGNVTSYQGQANSWDAGNMLAASTGSGYTKAYLYTADDERLATLDLSGATVQESWTLRGLGNQVLRTWSVNDGAWSWDRDQIYRGRQLAAAETAADAVALHYHLDHLGSPRLIMTSAGGVKSQHTYYPFGEEYTSPGSEILKFTGHERDENGSALDYDYMHARYCLPETGTFLSVDPINSGKPQVPQSWNKYVYGRNNPVKFVDPDGENPILVVGGLALGGVLFGPSAANAPEDLDTELIESGPAVPLDVLALEAGGGALGSLGARLFGRLGSMFDSFLGRGRGVSKIFPSGLKQGRGQKLSQQIARFRNAGFKGGREEFLDYANKLASKAEDAGTVVRGKVGKMEDAVIFRDGDSYLVVNRDGVIRSFVPNATPDEGIVRVYAELRSPQ